MGEGEAAVDFTGGFGTKLKKLESCLCVLVPGYLPSLAPKDAWSSLYARRDPLFPVKAVGV